MVVVVIVMVVMAVDDLHRQLFPLLRRLIWTLSASPKLLCLRTFIRLKGV